MYRHSIARPRKLWAKALLRRGLVLLTLSIAVASLVSAQPLHLTSDVPTFSGSMLRVRVATPNLMVFPQGGDPETFEYLYHPAGRFQIQTSPVAPDGGSPVRIGDENRPIASATLPFSDSEWGQEFTSKVTIAIGPDPLDPEVGAYQDPHALAVLRGNADSTAELLNFWPAPPTVGARDISGVFRVPVETIDADSDPPTDWIQVRQVLTVLGDAVQIEYIVQNTTNARHTVGLRVLIDGRFGGASNLDGQPIILPNGRRITTETTLPDPLNPSELMPTSWVSHSSPLNPVTSVRGIVDGTEVNRAGIAGSSAGPPDSISWGQMRNIGMDSQYYFTPNPQTSLIGEDWAYAVWWAPRELGPGESRRYVTYYGLGSSAADYEDPYALMAYSPHTLQVKTGDDPATDGIVEDFYLAGEDGESPFKIAAYMDNFGSAPIYDASVRVRLPEGFELAPGESATKTVGVLQRNTVAGVTWNVLATNARPGEVQVRFTGPRGKVVTRTISIPAIPVLYPIADAPLGLEMISIPYEFSDNDAENVFASLGSLLPGGPASLIRWDPAAEQYRWFPDPQVTTVIPGRGYWLLNRNRDTVVLPADATPVDDSRIYSYDLQRGWNQIGNPFTTTIRLDQVAVEGSGGIWSMEEAVERNLLLPTLYAYNPANNPPYSWQSSPGETYMAPYQGYWILALDNVTLNFAPPGLATASDAPVAAIKPSAASGWNLDILVSSPAAATTTQSLAVRGGAADGLDRFDVPQPPAGLRQEQVFLQSAFYPDGNASGMPCLVDARDPSASAHEWKLVIRSNAKSAPVTVTWPSMNALPSDLIATLIDEASGERRYMRTTSSYTFRTDDAASDRALKIVVQPRPAQGLAVTAVQTAQAANGVMLTYSLSADANVQIRVRNISGAVVSEIARDQVSVAGRNTALWNLRNARGSRVPSGRYLCEIIARSAETGQATSVVHPLEIKR